MKIGMCISSAILLLVTAVGGCDSDSGNRRQSEQRGFDVEEKVSLSVVVVGLDGEVTLEAGNQQISIDENGLHKFPSEIPVGSRVEVVVLDNPDNQQCVILGDAVFTMSVSTSEIQLACSGLGLVRGVVKDYRTGAVVNDVRISIHRYQDGESAHVIDFPVAENGEFTQGNLGTADRFSMTAIAPGYAAQTAVFSNSAENPIVDVVMQMIPATSVVQFSPLEEYAIVINGVEIAKLPDNAFVDEDGAVVQEDIVATITLIDPTGDPQLMSGDYQAMTTEGPKWIESFGAVDFRFETEDGKQLKLAEGKSADIRIPIASASVSAGLSSNVPMFYLDTEAGYWREDGVGALASEDGAMFYVATVSHFTTWNADAYFDAVGLAGCVEDGSGNRLGNVSVTAFGQNYNGLSLSVSNVQGEFVLPVKPDSVVLVSGSRNNITNTVVVEVGNQPMSMNQCLVLGGSTATIKLTWSDIPADLDSYLFLPAQIEDEIGFVNYGRQEIIHSGGTIKLDVDDTDSFGPEIITISGLSVPGTYSYMVENYSEESGLRSSGARVEVVADGRTWVFSADSAVGEHETGFWHVLDIVVDQQGDIRVVPVQRLRSEQEVMNTFLR